MLRVRDGAAFVDCRPQSWMYDLRSFIGHLAITQVFLVGSHNAATCNIRRKSHFGTDGPDLLSKRGGVCGPIARFFSRGICAKWARCQGMQVRAQLDLGVRYLDLRVISNPRDNNKLYITHGQMSIPLKDMVGDVKAFLEDPPSANEFIILDFQHLYDMNADTLNAFYEDMNIISNHFVPADVQLTTPLSDLWKASPEQRVFLLVGRRGLNHAAVRVRSRSVVSRWVNANSLRKLLDCLNKLLMDDIQKPAVSDVPPKLYVTQAVFTPNARSIVSGIFNRLSRKHASGICDVAARVNSSLIYWFYVLNAHSEVEGEKVVVPPYLNTHGNIFMLDYVHLGRCQLSGEAGEMELDAVGVCAYLNVLHYSQKKTNGPSQ